MDWLIMAIYLVLGLVAITGSSHGTWWQRLILTVASAGVLLWRRRYPVWTAAAIGALTVLTLFTLRDQYELGLAVALVTYAVAANRRPLIAWTTMIALVVVTCAASLAWLETSDIKDMFTGPPSGIVVESTQSATVIGIVLLALGAMTIGTTVRTRRMLVAGLVERANALARDREQHAQLAAAAERARIAREMHDVVAHSLTVMVALADGAMAATAKHPDLAVQALGELTSTGRTALTDMRRVLGALREPGADDRGDGAPRVPAGAVESPEDLVERFRTAGLPVRFTRSGYTGDLSVSVRAAAQRIMQEALTNVLRYAPTSPLVTVELTRSGAHDEHGEDWLEIRVANTTGPADRAVPSPPVGTGRGIIGMRERAGVHGGTVQAGPTGTGWLVHATLRIR